MDNLEREIAELQQKIEEKKNLLEQQGGIVEEKELVGSALREIFTGAAQPASSNPATGATASVTPAASTVASAGTYLDSVDDETAETISRLIQKLPETGIAKAVAEAELAGPFLVDVLHDALVDKMYEELVKRGFIKTK